MIKTLLKKLIGRNQLNDSGYFTINEKSEIWISEQERKDHIKNFGQPQPVIGKSRFLKSLEQQKLEDILRIVPEGIVVEWRIANGVIEFLVKEKPLDFSEQQVQELIEELNSIALKNAEHFK